MCYIGLTLDVKLDHINKKVFCFSCRKCENADDLRKLLKDYIDTFYSRYGVLLLLYSVILTKVSTFPTVGFYSTSLCEIVYDVKTISVLTILNHELSL